MIRTAMNMVAALLWLAGASAAWAQEVQTPERAIPGRYIVVLDDQQVASVSVTALADAMVRQHGGRVRAVYEHAIRGFAATMSATAAAALARNPRVRYVEQDSERFIVDTQPNATWGLDRIDQRDRPLNATYTYTTLATGVHVYVIDTGIRSTHAEFGGRVSSTGYTAISDGNGTNDCNGHGTHVAATAGGATYGVAKGVTLHAVRVLDCSGSGTTSGVIAGVNWVTANHTAPAVANMSLGGGASTALDDAVRNSVASGVTYAIAAGNSNANACSSSPARVSQALTVGSSTNTDARSSFSNFGTCVDLFAPGSGITSAWYTSNTATMTISGTSMAAPHVAGAAALYLATNPSAPPAPCMRRLSTTRASTSCRASARARRTASSTRSSAACRWIARRRPPSHIRAPAWRARSTAAGRPTIAASAATPGTSAILKAPLEQWSRIPMAAAAPSPCSLTVTDTANQTGTQSQSVTISGGGAPARAARRTLAR